MRTDVHGEVVSNERVAPDAFVLRWSHAGTLDWKPGEFLQLAAWGNDPLLRRPMSVLDFGAGWTSVFYQVLGRGTRALSMLRTGDRVRALGPLGKSFGLPSREGHALIVAGGVGVAPFLTLTRELRRARRDVVVLLGAREASRLYLRGELEIEGARVHCATENGEAGTKGLVTDLLRAELAKGSPVGRLYTCGPEPMMRAVHAIAREHGVPGEASLERRMACGFGVCFTCVCPMVDTKTGVVRNKRTCLEGPVVDLELLPVGAW